MSTTEVRPGGTAAAKASSAELLEAIRASLEKQRLQQIDRLDRIEAACLMIAGGALGTMSAVCFGQNNIFLQLVAPFAFLVGFILGLMGMIQQSYPRSRTEVREARKREAVKFGNGPPPLKV